MQVVIPMSGVGKRFLDAGYTVPKYLIEMDGMPIIEHVVNMFKGETEFIFICNSEHLQTTNVREVLNRIAPQGKVVEIPPHKKGPVYAVQQISDLLRDDEEVIVNYCDFAVYWDYADFLKHTRERNADGAVPAYKGFHPHMLGTTNYAFMRDKDQWMLEIKEKEPFTDNRMNEYASIGTYYFKKGEYVKKYFTELIDRDINLNGEFYASLVYNLLVEDNLSVSIYDIQHMLQWGTPQDVAEYNTWSRYFKRVITEKKPLVVEKNSVTLVPMAGRGQRFADVGYTDPKPLIDVSGKPMVIQAVNSAPTSESITFICLEDHLKRYPIEDAIRNEYKNVNIVSLNEVTEGQACTCEVGLKDIDKDSPLLIVACDNGMTFDEEKYAKLINDHDTDAIVWTFRNNESSERNPQMYGWIKVDDKDNVTGVSIKKPISDNPKNDHAVVGTFYFKKAQYFLDALNKMYEDNTRINGEFYVDSTIGVLVEMGRKAKVFELDDYICWGTPNDYKTFKYWQSFFHKVEWHPYSLEKDITLNKNSVDALNKEYRTFEQENR